MTTENKIPSIQCGIGSNINEADINQFTEPREYDVVRLNKWVLTAGRNVIADRRMSPYLFYTKKEAIEFAAKHELGDEFSPIIKDIIYLRGA